MIIYDLSCNNGHRFEGWFHSADAFQAQQSQHLVTCPQCESHDVQRLPSAIAIATHHRQDSANTTANVPTGSMNTAVLPAGTQVMSMYRQLLQTLIDHSEDVGESFADEARKIHFNEAPERPIRGSATDEECEALRDEGIPVLSLPGIKEEEVH